jgi:hypothetical protein
MLVLPLVRAMVYLPNGIVDRSSSAPWSISSNHLAS